MEILMFPAAVGQPPGAPPILDAAASGLFPFEAA
jgi:hypothetical protein